MLFEYDLILKTKMCEFNQLIDARLKMFDTYIGHANLDMKDYQREGVKWCLVNELRPESVVRGGFIADEMGLGKTIIMIGVFLSNFVKRTLIVLPPSLLDQWFAQILRTTGHRALIYHGEKKKKISDSELNQAKIVITTYGTISLSKRGLTSLHGIKWSRVVFDEAHHLRNSRTAVCAGARRLQSKIRWLVSGTPVQNRKQDFYSLCSILKLPASVYTEPANLNQLGSFILKRTKRQVGIQIPGATIEKNVVEWSNREEMELAENIHASRGSKLTLMLRARQSCILPKLMDACKLSKIGLHGDYAEAFRHSSKLDFVVKEIIERKGNGCGKLIFCHFREEIDEIFARLSSGGIGSVATVDGRTRHRGKILNSPHEALVLQIQTGCEGLNLQENYSEIYFISPHWNPAVEDQAIARCHRIGQKKEVLVKRFEMNSFVGTPTLETYIKTVQEIKRNIATECIN